MASKATKSTTGRVDAAAAADSPADSPTPDTAAAAARGDLVSLGAMVDGDYVTDPARLVDAGHELVYGIVLGVEEDGGLQLLQLGPARRHELPVHVHE